MTVRTVMGCTLGAALFAAVALRAETPVAPPLRNIQVLHTAELIALEQGDLVEGAADPTGLEVELLFVPSAVLQRGETTVLRDEITGVACAPGPAALKRIGRLGDDFLVVRGVMGPRDPANGRELKACQVIGYDGVAWEEARAIESGKQHDLFRAGRL